MDDSNVICSKVVVVVLLHDWSVTLVRQVVKFWRC